MQNSNPLFEFNLNLDVSVVGDHVMTRALADVMNNLDGPAKRKRAFY
jgi:hypothetical protein